MDAISSLKSKTVVVYANSKADWEQLPQKVQQALSSNDAGRFIPKTIIVDAELSEVIAVVPYNGDEGERSKLFREAKKKIAAKTKN